MIHSKICQRVVLFVSSLFLLIGMGANAGAADESCECAASKCAPCENETGTTFYSAKCGPKNARVKSCKKATCEPVENQKQCLAALSQPNASPWTTELPQARTSGVVNLAPEAGQIVNLQGEYRVTHSNGISEQPRKRDPAFVGDIFETRAESSVKIILNDGSELTIAPDSKLKIEKVSVEASALKRQVALRVLAGRVRNKVSKDYKGENTYQVSTPAAIAGVRGTDFITSYVLGENGWISEVRTLEGLVRFSTASARSGAISKFIDIPAGTFAVFEEEGEKLSPLYQLKTDEMHHLQHQDFLVESEKSQRKSPARSLASVSVEETQPICSAPVGKFQQCSFTRENDVCVRRICRANGQWADQRRLPASEARRCDAKTVVGDCGQYW
jgi:hypothetical protein